MRLHLLDTDFYKLLMMQFLLKYSQFDRQVKYTFKLRKSEGIYFDWEFENKFGACLRNVEYMELLTDKEVAYLKGISGMESWFIDWLRSYRPDPNAIKWSVKDGVLTLTIEGKWSEIIWWEVPLMAMISEFYNEQRLKNFDKKLTQEDVHYGLERCNLYDHKRFLSLGNAKVVEFGTRRRFSQRNQERVVEILRKYPCYAGTSNILLAMQNNEHPKGTMAHELFMGIAPHVGYKKVYGEVLNKWYDMYKPHYLIALTDTFSTKHFFENVGDSILYMYDGVRQDSYSEYAFATRYHHRMSGFYKMDLSKKSITYSNALTGETIRNINGWNYFPFDKRFGWGTGLTNDVKLGVPTATALNMVIKLTESGGKPTIKISDDSTKAMGPQETIDAVLSGVL
jgi:nicotinate phosphoribosyltransferase